MHQTTSLTSPHVRTEWLNLCLFPFFVCFGAADNFFFHGNCKKDLRHTRNVQSRLQDIHAAHRQLFLPPRVATAPSTLSGSTSHLPGAATSDRAWMVGENLFTPKRWGGWIALCLFWGHRRRWLDLEELQHGFHIEEHQLSVT